MKSVEEAIEFIASSYKTTSGPRIVKCSRKLEDFENEGPKNMSNIYQKKNKKAISVMFIFYDFKIILATVTSQLQMVKKIQCSRSLIVAFLNKHNL